MQESKQGYIQQTVFGGQGLLKEADGRVVFIPYALDGEKVLYQVTESHRWYARANLCQVIEPHNERVEAPCPHYGTCEGCQLQHASHQHQLQLKQQWLQELLLRIGKLQYEVPPFVSCQPWQYRRSVEWIWQESQLGYSSSQGQFIPIQVCFLLKNSLTALSLARECMLSIGVKKARLRWLQGLDTEKVLLAIDTGESINAKSLESFGASHLDQFSGLILHSKKKVRQVVGSPYSEGHILGFPIRWHGLGFVQNHPQGSLAFYRWIEDRLKSNASTSESSNHLIDLYCGVGITSLLAARAGYKVSGFELSPVAISSAKYNAKVAQLSHACQFYCRNLNMEGTLSKQTAKHWIANPPKAGLSPAMIQAIAKSAKHVYYLSCHPATLARDLKTMRDLGFSIQGLQAFDCFAQTTHFETVVHLERTN